MNESLFRQFAVSSVWCHSVAQEIVVNHALRWFSSSMTRWSAAESKSQTTWSYICVCTRSLWYMWACVLCCCCCCSRTQRSRRIVGELIISDVAVPRCSHTLPSQTLSISNSYRFTVLLHFRPSRCTCSANRTAGRWAHTSRDISTTYVYEFKVSEFTCMLPCALHSARVLWLAYYSWSRTDAGDGGGLGGGKLMVGVSDRGGSCGADEGLWVMEASRNSCIFHTRCLKGRSCATNTNCNVVLELATKVHRRDVRRILFSIVSIIFIIVFFYF